MRRSFWVLPLAFWGCADGGGATEPLTGEPPPPLPVVAGLRGVVDGTTGTLTFEPIRAPPRRSSDRPPSMATKVSPFGSTTHRLLVANSSTPGKETYTAGVGIQNLLAHPMGDEQAGTPLDTMGIYVFVTSGPTVTATSSALSGASLV